MKLRIIYYLALLIAAINVGLIQGVTSIQQTLAKATMAPKKLAKAKVLKLSTESLDEIKIYNDTPYPVTLVVYNPYNTDIRDTFTIESGETFYKNARLHDSEDHISLAKLLLYDLEKKKRILLLYQPRIEFLDDSWHSITLLVSKLLK